MKKRLRRMALFASLLLCVTGCGAAKVPEEVTEDSLVISKEGKMTEYLVSDFAEDYYSIDELQEMAKEEADSVLSGAVSFEEAVLLEDGKARVVFQYDSVDAYNSFQENTLFLGTLAEASTEGYDARGLISVKNGESISEEKLEKYQEKMLVVTDAKANIYCPSKVLYLSEGAAIAEDGGVKPSEAEELVYILIK